ncbi:hypothetical protein B0H14DRAFT_2584414 [Mycena olivaceomarginata]|nr:hypothetical protein B0H14DRAFT_2584414 [Mycena olivaceomarginata]
MRDQEIEHRSRLQTRLRKLEDMFEDGYDDATDYDEEDPEEYSRDQEVEDLGSDTETQEMSRQEYLTAIVDNNTIEDIQALADCLRRTGLYPEEDNDSTQEERTQESTERVHTQEETREPRRLNYVMKDHEDQDDRIYREIIPIEELADIQNDKNNNEIKDTLVQRIITTREEVEELFQRLSNRDQDRDSDHEESDDEEDEARLRKENEASRFRGLEYRRQFCEEYGAITKFCSVHLTTQSLIALRILDEIR